MTYVSEPSHFNEEKALVSSSYGCDFDYDGTGSSSASSSFSHAYSPSFSHAYSPSFSHAASSSCASGLSTLLSSPKPRRTTKGESVKNSCDSVKEIEEEEGKEVIKVKATELSALQSRKEKKKATRNANRLESKGGKSEKAAVDHSETYIYLKNAHPSHAGHDSANNNLDDYSCFHGSNEPITNFEAAAKTEDDDDDEWISEEEKAEPKATKKTFSAKVSSSKNRRKHKKDETNKNIAFEKTSSNRGSVSMQRSDFLSKKELSENKQQGKPKKHEISSCFSLSGPPLHLLNDDKVRQSERTAMLKHSTAYSDNYHDFYFQDENKKLDEVSFCSDFVFEDGFYEPNEEDDEYDDFTFSYDDDSEYEFDLEKFSEKALVYQIQQMQQSLCIDDWNEFFQLKGELHIYMREYLEGFLCALAAERLMGRETERTIAIKMICAYQMNYKSVCIHFRDILLGMRNKHKVLSSNLLKEFEGTCEVLNFLSSFLHLVDNTTLDKSKNMNNTNSKDYFLNN